MSRFDVALRFKIRTMRIMTLLHEYRSLIEEREAARRRVAEIDRRIEQVEVRLQGLLGKMSSVDDSTTNGSSRPSAAPGLPREEPSNDASLADRVVALLAANPKTSYKAGAISQALAYENTTVVRGTLARLTRERRIRRIGKGLYRAMLE